MNMSPTVNQTAWIKQRGKGESEGIISTLLTKHLITATCCTKVFITGTNEHTIHAHV